MGSEIEAETPTPNPDDSTTKTPSTSATLQVERKDDNVVVIDGKQYVVQDHVNTLIGTARTEGKNAGKTEAEKAADAARQAAEAEALTEQGQFKTLYEAEQQKVKDLQDQLDAEKTRASELELSSIRAKVAAKHKIPEALVPKIAGSTEAEMDADAKIMAENLGTPKPVNTQTGSGGPGQGGSTRNDGDKDDKGTQKPKTPYGFQTPGEIAW